MGGVFSIDADNSLALFNLTNKLHIDELISLISEYLELGGSQFAIFDFSDFKGPGFSTEDIKTLATFLTTIAYRRTSDGKTAVVAKRDIDFGNFRMLSALIEDLVPYRFRVFRNISKAYEWFGLSKSIS